VAKYAEALPRLSRGGHRVVPLIAWGGFAVDAISSIFSI
jgi:hypothetical protein